MQGINHYQCIIIGAGAAGIAAAKTLHQQNYPYIVLESRLRIGGRLYSQLVDDIKLDLGASWIHSFTAQNPLFKFVQNNSVKQCQLSGPRICGRVYIDGQTGEQFNQQIKDYAHYNMMDYFNTARQTVQFCNNDLSIDNAAQNFYQRKQMCDSERRCTQAFINMTEHYQASSTCQLSAKYFQYQQDQGGDYFPEGTYASLMKNIANGLNIQLNKHVVHIIRNNTCITIECRDGSIYTCKNIIISLPLGVLKNKCVKFTPQIPDGHQRAIDRLGVGIMNKLILSFQQNFWGPVNWVTIGCDERGKFPHFYNISQNGKNILCCFLTDTFALKVEQYSDEQIVAQALRLLQKIYGQNKIKLKQSKLTRWASDERSFGSYASFHVGSTPDDCFQLRKSIQNRMFFVGQHCYAQHLGTAHGAFKTGQWASKQILNITNWVNPIFMQPMHMI